MICWSTRTLSGQRVAHLLQQKLRRNCWPDGCTAPWPCADVRKSVNIFHGTDMDAWYLHPSSLSALTEPIKKPYCVARVRV